MVNAAKADVPGQAWSGRGAQRRCSLSRGESLVTNFTVRLSSAPQSIAERSGQAAVASEHSGRGRQRPERRSPGTDRARSSSLLRLTTARFAASTASREACLQQKQEWSHAAPPQAKRHKLSTARGWMRWLDAQARKTEIRLCVNFPLFGTACEAVYLGHCGLKFQKATREGGVF